MPPRRQQIQPGDRPSGNIRGTRSPAVGRRGMIATSQTLASAAGLKVLQDGGNAIDAAVTAAAVLAVIEPSMNGIGGDLLALVYDAKTKKVYGLDSTGRSAHAATPAEYAKRGLTRDARPRPARPSTCPASSKAGTSCSRDSARSTSPARSRRRSRSRATDFPVAELMANEWQDNASTLAADAAHGGDVPAATASRRSSARSSPTRAWRASLESIAKEGRDAFYKGSIARAIVADMKARDGLLELRDFADHKADWVEPISTSYRGYDVLEMPPSTQGFVALEMLNIMEGFDIKALGHNSADYLHVVSEAKRIAFADRGAFLADRDHMPKGVLQTPALEGLRRDTPQGDQHGEGHAALRGVASAGSAGGRFLRPSISATRST